VFTLNIKDKNLGEGGGLVILGVTGDADTVLEVSRVGDAVLDETDIAPEIYKAKTEPTAFTLSGQNGKTLKYVDMTGTEKKAVYSAADKRYHLNSESGPVLYMNLGMDAKYISMYKMLGFDTYGGTGLNKSFYDENGEFIKKEDYTECMSSYVEKMDEETGLYPLTEDLIYMVQNGGEFKGWWEEGNPSYLFGELEGFNPANGWMYAVCYFE